MLGKLGHSGDTDTPHEHYPLQAGPDSENADALPCKFTDVGEPILDRGTCFEARRRAGSAHSSPDSVPWLQAIGAALPFMFFPLRRGRGFETLAA